MSMGVFEKDNGQQLALDDDRYLLPFMTPTSASTKLRDGPPEGAIKDHQKGRILLQIHQLLYLAQTFEVDLVGKKMLDVGTGNGMIPCLALELSGLASAVGADPYLDGELPVSWQVHDHGKIFQELVSFIRTYCPTELIYDKYRHLLAYENYSMIPGPVRLSPKKSKPYRFAQVGVHDLHELQERSDIVYAKAVEHISDWEGMFRSLAAATNPDGVVLFKHRTFFSYLGAHRRSSLGIPWGHLLLSDEEYRRCAKEFYPDDAERMIDFYFHHLTYPRETVSDMVMHAQKHGFFPLAVISEPPRYIKRVASFIDEVDDFYRILRDNHPRVNIAELLSGMYHIIFRKQ